MMKFVKHVALAAAAVFFSLSVQAQRKDLGDDQYFKSNFKGITSPMPSVVKWLDDSHVILKREGKIM